MSSAFQSTEGRVEETTYFLARLIVSAKGRVHSGKPLSSRGGRQADSINS
jgi:hypothetical protein